MSDLEGDKKRKSDLTLGADESLSKRAKKESNEDSLQQTITAAERKEALEKYRKDYRFLNSEKGIRFRDDIEFLMDALDEKHNIDDLMSMASPRAKDHKEFMLKAVSVEGKASLKMASDRLKDDFDVVKAAVTATKHKHRGGWQLRYASKRLQDNKDIVLAMIRACSFGGGDGLYHVSKRLWADRDVVIAAMEEEVGIGEFVAPELKEDRELLLMMVENDWRVVLELPEKFHKDIDILSAVDIDDVGDHLNYYPDCFWALPEYFQNIKALRHSRAGSKYLKIENLSDEEDDLELVDLCTSYNHNFCVLDEVLERCSERVKVVFRMRSDASTFPDLDEEYRGDPDAAEAAVQVNRANLQHASTRIQTLYQVRDDPSSFAGLESWAHDDYDIAKTAVQGDPGMMKHANKAFWKNESFMLDVIAKHGSLFELVDPGLKSDRYFAWRALKQNGKVYRYLDASLKADKILCSEAAAENTELVLKNAPEIFDDRKFLLKIVPRNPALIQHLPDHKSDRELILSAPGAAQFASQSLWTEKDFVAKIVSTYPFDIRFAPDHVQRDKETVLAACKHKKSPTEIFALAFVKKFLADRDFVMALVGVKPEALEFIVSDQLKADREVFLAAALSNVQVGFNCLQYAANSLKADRSFVLAMVKQNGRSLQHASQELKADAEVVLAAADQNSSSLRDADWESLRTKRSFIMDAFEKYGEATGRAVVWMLTQEQLESLWEDREILLKALQNSGSSILRTTQSLSWWKDDRELLMTVVRSCRIQVFNVWPELKDDSEVMLVLLDHDPGKLYLASATLRNAPNFMAQAMQRLADKQRKLFAWKRFATRELQARMKSAVAAMTRHTDQLGAARGKKIKVWLSSLKSVKSRAKRIERDALENFWLCAQISNAQVPKEVVKRIQEFSGTCQEAVNAQLQQTKDLVYCGPLFVEFSRGKETYWKDVPFSV